MVPTTTRLIVAAVPGFYIARKEITERTMCASCNCEDYWRNEIHKGRVRRRQEELFRVSEELRPKRQQ